MDDRNLSSGSDDWGNAPDASTEGPVEDWGVTYPVAEPTTVPAAAGKKR